MTLPQTKVLIVVFDSVNTLDVNGPLEVLCNFALRRKDGTSPYHITIASNDARPVHTYESINLLAHISFEDALTNIRLQTYDVLIVPGYGGGRPIVQGLIDRKDRIFDVIRAFRDMPVPAPRPEQPQKQRWLISICVGASINAYAGVFDGQTTTTHWGALDDISYFSRGKAKAVRERWMETGDSPTPNGIRILSSGGISCGIDAMLYFLSQQGTHGLNDAQRVASVMDYKWNGGPSQPPDLPITEQNWTGKHGDGSG